jgi:hypothetical protein
MAEHVSGGLDVGSGGGGGAEGTDEEVSGRRRGCIGRKRRRG